MEACSQKDMPLCYFKLYSSEVVINPESVGIAIVLSIDNRVKRI